MHVAALVVGALVCVAIIAIGARFLVSPRVATTGYGLAPGDARGLTAAKGVRDIASGILVLVVWATAAPSPSGGRCSPPR